MTSWKSILVENLLTQLLKNNKTWNIKHAHCIQKLLPTSIVIHSKKSYSMHVIKSPYKDCDIPDVTLNEYLYNITEQFADYPALVSMK